ncbi:MAG: CinA family nicotinamide mononucleotide deamidase-related protein [Persicimonas sp.]
MPTVSALSIGDELLDGRIEDRNATWLAGTLGEYGGDLCSIRVVGDDMDVIVAALEQAGAEADYIVVSGGLGPTADDLTRDAAAQWVGEPLELDEALLEQLKERFARRGYRFTDNNRRQCMFPAGAEVLPTEVGTAAGFAVEKEGTRAVFLPGVPSEYRWFVDSYVLGELGRAEDLSPPVKLTFFGIGESSLETKLAGIEELAEQLDSRVGYRAAFPIIEVLLKAPGAEAADRLRQFALERAGRWLVTEGDEAFAARLGRRLLENDATVTAAESCTAGRICAKLTEVSGSSGWFERGFITYANRAKCEMLGVTEQILERFGAVSAQTVCQMASGARRQAGSTFAVAVSGIAGPTGGTPDKPVGTVHFALAGPEGVWHRQMAFPKRGRQRTLSASVYTGLSLLLWRLEDRIDEHRVNGPFCDDEVWADQGVLIDDSHTETTP